MSEPWSDPTHDVMADLDAVWRTRKIELAKTPPWLKPIRPRVPQFPAPYPLTPIETAVKRVLPLCGQCRICPRSTWSDWFGDPLADVRAELQRFLDDYTLEGGATHAHSIDQA